MSLFENCIVPDWPVPSNVKALQTTRLGGVSAAPYATLNLGSHVGDAPLAVAHNRMLLAPLLPSEPVWLEQVHGVSVVDAANADCRPRADASISSRAGAVCVVMTADCLPLLLCNTDGTVVGAVHAGWRGLCAGMIENAVRAMRVPPPSLMAWLGPAIGQVAFEVGDEVRTAFTAQQAAATAAFMPGITGKWQADIYMLARQRLHALGVTKIYGGDLCTYSDRDRFYSHRRDGVSGRTGTFIWME